MSVDNELEKEYCQSFLELKNDLKEKYTSRIYAVLKDVRETLVERTSDMFDDGFFTCLNEAFALEEEKEKIRKAFFRENDYEDAQKKLKLLRKKHQEEGGEEVGKELSEAVARVSTLNVTIRNRLKPYEERIEYLREKIDGSVEANRERIDSLKKEIVETTRTSVDEIVTEFNRELSELKETFGVPEGESELPFDERTLQLEIPISEFDPDHFMKNVKRENRDLFVKSDNSNHVKN